MCFGADFSPNKVAATSIEEVATGLEAPWSIAFSRDGTIYFTERPGRIRVIKQGVLLEQPVTTINVTTFPGGEAGLLGLTLDPDFTSNSRVFVYYTYTDSQNQTWNRVSALTETNGQLGDEQFLLDGIKGANIHNGGRLKVGPDGKLYVTTGEANNKPLAQNLSSLNGKILRVNLDGSIPSDNPIQGSLVYSYGHRNPQGLAWDASGRLFASEHGQSGNDEVNLIQPGENYGWPIVQGVAGDPPFVDPVVSTGSETWAPSGTTFYTESKIPEWTGKLLVATLRGQHLRVLDISLSTPPKALSSTPFLSGTYGRLRDVVQGPDGFLYIATSNRDGRGTANAGDDKILRITGTAGLPSGRQTFPVYILLAAATGAAFGLSFLAVRRMRRRKRTGK